MHTQARGSRDSREVTSHAEVAGSRDEPASCALPCIDVAALAQHVRPAIVNITTTEEQRLPELSSSEQQLFHFFFGGPVGDGAKVLRRTGIGSGFIIDRTGYVVTNEHVVHDATAVRVLLADERELDAEVVGRDSNLDIALIRIHGDNDLPVLPFGSSSALRVGDPVVAVGNPFGLGHTVTLGIVSAKGRALGAGPYDDFIQTDASINPGNSGGPLLNSKGEVVGINTIVHAGASGIGFAIPSDDMKDVLPELRAHGHIARGKLGLRVQTVTPELARALHLDGARGALIADLDPRGGGAKAGLRSGDVILSIDDTPIAHAEELARVVAKHPPGASVAIRFSRDGRPESAKGKLDKLEEDTPAPKPVLRHVPKDGIKSIDRIGLEVGDAPEGGARVEDILPGRDAGDLEPGDVIVEFGGAKVRDAASLAALAGRMAPNTSALLKVTRDEGSRFSALVVK